VLRDEWARLTPDGRLLVSLLALILLGPYLPILDLVKLVGIDLASGHQQARLDNVAIPAVAAYLLWRGYRTNRFRLPIHTIFYAVFLLWLGAMTAVWWSNIPADYSGSISRGVSLLSSAEAYVRPLLVLLIAANVQVSRTDMSILIKLILAAAVSMSVIATLQLLPYTEDVINPFLARFYDNSAGSEAFWLVVENGRAAALMPQLSTLGMYLILAAALAAVFIFRIRSRRDSVVLGLLFGTILLGGMLSGSKIFPAGMGLLVVLSAIYVRAMPRISPSKILVAVLLFVVVWAVAALVFPDQSKSMRGRIFPDDGNYINQYFAGRFDPDTGKVFRNGAVDIAQDYPITGLGMSVVNRTTDSMLLGIVIMSGVVGFTLYSIAIGLVLWRLWQISVSDQDRELKALARTLTLLTIVFVVISVAFHTLIQDRAGDAYWLLVGLVIGPLAMKTGTAGELEPDSSA
jgi:hypothetical protein